MFLSLFLLGGWSFLLILTVKDLVREFWCPWTCEESAVSLSMDM